MEQYSNENTSLFPAPFPPFYAATKAFKLWVCLPSPSFATPNAGFKSDNYAEWFIAVFCQRSEQTQNQEDPFDGHSRHAAAVKAILFFFPVTDYHLSKLLVLFRFFFGFFFPPKFWMQEFPICCPFLAPLFATSLRRDSWAMAFPGRCDNWKLW